MQLTRSSLLSIALAIQAAMGAYVPSEPWSTLTPSGSIPSGAITDYPSSFGIAIQSIGSATASAGAAKRGFLDLVKKDVASQITDGQVQATTGKATKTTKAAVTQITDGQVQATTATKKSTKAAVTQITDGQVQATTGKTTKTTEAAVTQITDGQVQATTGKTTEAAVTQIGDGQVQATTGKTTEAAVTQIGDGQVQATTGKTTKAAVSQIGDGQVQATTATTKAAISQITDGQIQATTGTTTTKNGASQITDGQVQAETGASSSEGDDGQVTDVDGDEVDDPVTAVSCSSDDTLSLTLNSSILYDAKGRIGSIVANRQFQFDGPPPQAGAIYAAGWSITDDGLLALGNDTSFYQCLSGTFYNLYDEDIGSVCYEVNLQVVDLVDC